MGSQKSRIDTVKLFGVLMRYHGGGDKVWRVVKTPSVKDEDPRVLHRESEVLRKERMMHSNGIKGLLTQQGV